jgi:Dpy-30 motif
VHVAELNANGEKDHPDAAYIKSNELGLVVAKGLAVMYKAQPSNPVDFLAKWLLNYSNI